MRTEKVIRFRLKELEHLWRVTDKGKTMFKSRRWMIKGQIKMLEWVLNDK